MTRHWHLIGSMLVCALCGLVCAETILLFLIVETP